jgi:integrase
VEQKKLVLQENIGDLKGQNISFAWYFQKNGRKETTIETYIKYIELLSKYCNLYDPELIKLAIATHYQNQNTKRSACCAYNVYLKFAGKEWIRPKYKLEDKQVFIPIDDELQIAINSGSRTSIIFSYLLYETGARVNEGERLEWTDINLEHCQVTLKSSKNGKAGTVNLSKQLINKLMSLPKTQKTVFKKRVKGSRQVAFRNRMKRLARTHDNPRLEKIHYHTLRHCKALRISDKTHIILRVKRILRHRSILTTQRYVELYEELYVNRPRETVCEIALNAQEAKTLIEQGFKYETGEYDDGGKLFKKFR